MRIEEYQDGKAPGSTADCRMYGIHVEYETMSAELIAILAFGVSHTLLMVTLAAFLLATHRGINERLTAIAKAQADLHERIAKLEADLRERIGELEADLRERIGELEADLRERIANLETDLRERIAKLEGLVEGLRDALTGRRADRTDAA